MKRRLSIFLCFALLSCLLTGCGGAGRAENLSSDLKAPEYGIAETMPAKDSSSLSGNTVLDSSVSSDRKLIKTVRISAESQNYTELLTTLDGTIVSLGGYVESREQYNGNRRSCSMIIRIPADALNQFVQQVNEDANVISSSETATDVTLDYVDTEAKVTALETEQARLLELLAEAESLYDILEIESRLGEVTYELERYASRLRSLENLVSYATVYLDLREVAVLTPKEDPTVWERISGGFAESVSDLWKNITDTFVWVIVESPNLLMWAILLSLGWMLIKRLKFGKKKKSTPPPAQSE